MKKIFAFVAAALMFVGCNSTKNYVVEGNIEDFSGQVLVTDFEGQTILGLATVKDGSFSIDVDNEQETPFIGVLTIDNTPICPIFFDAEKVIVEGNIYGGLIVSGSEANDAFVAFQEATAEFENNLPEDFDVNNPAPEVNEAIAELLGEQFEANKDNLFGGFLIVSGMVPAETPEQLLGYIDALGKEPQSLPQVQSMKSFVEQAMAEEAAATEEETAAEE